MRQMTTAGRPGLPGGVAAFVESLAATPFVGWFRRRTSSEEYRQLTCHLSWSDICNFGAPLEPLGNRPHYLLSTLAFFFLFVLRSESLYRIAMWAFVPVDRLLLGLRPGLARLAWRGLALRRKLPHAC